MRGREGQRKEGERLVPYPGPGQGVEKEERGYPPISLPVDRQADTSENITFPSHYVRGR